MVPFYVCSWIDVTGLVSLIIYSNLRNQGLPHIFDIHGK